ncbi:MAG: phosphotransferase, partial [bacterium]|nr:phosphotransferase [bacterium]
MENQGEIKLKIQKLLGAEITQFLLKGQGYCNDAYYVETGEDNKYIVKQERNNKKAEEQNNLLVEAGVIQELYKMNLSVPSPCVVFVSEKPKMYGYKYIEGEMMKDVWGSLSEKEKIDICHTIGIFHAEIGKVFTKEIARASSVKIDESPYVHPEVTDEYNKALASVDVPDEFKMLVKKAKVIFDGTSKKVVFQFIHNDPHHENIIIRDKKISGIIDFGAAEWGEVAKEFSRYIRDYPDYFQHIVSAYEKESGHKLSYERLVSNALLCDFPDIVENY